MICAELCAGGGGTAIGLEQASFIHSALVEDDGDCYWTLRQNRPGWPVCLGDITKGHLTIPVDLVSAGLPCTPHSRGGRQLGRDDERHLWDAALRIIGEARPRAVMLETADAILGPKFDGERDATVGRLAELGYTVRWEVLDACWYGVPQRRKRAILVAFREPAAAAAFGWPAPSPLPPPVVGDVLYPLIAARGWRGADAWRARVRGIAPVVTGGSKKHGGADLGASQGKNAWRKLGINPMGIADEAPGPDGCYRRGVGKFFYTHMDGGPMLTVPMAALLQGFPPGWQFCGGKTAQYRQVGNALPSPVARAVGTSIRSALEKR